MIRLSDLLLRFDAHKVPPGGLREQAAALCFAEFGPGVDDLPAEMVNVAALAVSMRSRIVVHQASDGIAGTVAATDLDEYPPEPPRLVRGAWVIESRVPHRPLFGSTCDVGGYWLEDVLYLVGLQYPDGATVAPMRPTWGGGLITGVRTDDPVLGDATALDDWSVQAMRFAVVLGVLMDAERTPVVATSRPSFAKRRPTGTARQSQWTLSRLYIDRAYQSRSGGGGAADTEGKREATVAVRGHLKQQAHGPQNTLRKWVYVAEYQARRWVSPLPARRIIGGDADG